jgi:hypothetical protein
MRAPIMATKIEAAPKVGMVSLGCPKALVDSERILTKLRADGYAMSPDYEGADVVLVNTCGFLDSAKEESLEAIGEAIAENGRVIVTGCMGNEADLIRARFPEVLASPARINMRMWCSGPSSRPARAQRLCRSGARRRTLKLTPRHYSYLKISEGCNHACSLLHHPALRGKLASRRIDAVLREAEKLVAAGTKELLVISQDTSAYGVDTRHEPREWKGRQVRAHMTDLARELGQLRTPEGRAPWVRLHYVYPYPHVDDVIPLMAEGLLTPYLDIPFQHAAPPVLKAMKRPANEAKVLERIRNWRESPRYRHPFELRRRLSPAKPRPISSICSTGSTKRSSTASAPSGSNRSKAPPPMPARCRARRGQGRALSAHHGKDRRDQRRQAGRQGRPHAAGDHRRGGRTRRGWQHRRHRPQPGRCARNRRQCLPARCARNAAAGRYRRCAR